MSALANLRRLGRDERGASLVELAACVIVFLLIFFALLDFGRMAYNWTMAEKAVQRAARLAAVLPPVCTGVPDTNQKVSSATMPYGSSCNTSTSPCVAPPVAACNGSTENSTASFIHSRVSALLPPGATAENLRYTYSYDPAMNFLGGPYVPLVAVELRNLNFQFVSPLSALARAAGAAAGTNTDGTIPLPPMSVSLPGEDLAVGTNG